MRSPANGPARAQAHGVGVIWWPELDMLCRPDEGLVHVIEVEPETFWVAREDTPDRFTSPLSQKLLHLPQPKLLHGVGAPFGGNVLPTVGHRESLASDIAALQPDWVSDHLSFNQFRRIGADNAEPINTGFLLPPAQCADGVAVAVEQIRRRRVQTGLPVAFEVPVSYLPRRPGEMADGSFASAVATEADCGILLDLHNILCNERNGRQTMAAFCASIPLDRVWEIHLAGGQEAAGLWMDAHCGLVEPVLIDLLEELVPRLPALRAVMFEIMPDYIESVGLSPIAAMLGRLNDVWSRHRPLADAPMSRRTSASIDHIEPGQVALTETAPPQVNSGDMSSAIWESAIGAAVVGIPRPELPSFLAGWVSDAKDRLSIYRNYSQENRASNFVETTPQTIRHLLRHIGETKTRALLGRFYAEAMPAFAASVDARGFLEFLAASDIVSDGLDDCIASDRALLAASSRIST
ncbi:MAG TPA: DUF692 family protein [Acetobacteraceae bacterium]|nr:DUF692 family protein [Acetobacteraceae bacterium]